MKKKTLIITTSAMLAFSLAGCSYSSMSNTTTNAITTAIAKKGEMKVEVSGTGTVQPTSTQNISVASAATINTVNVQTGQTVKKGDTILTFKGQDNSVQISHQQIALEKQKLQLSQLQQSLSDEDKNLTVYSPIGGTVESINVSDGDPVQQGTAVMTIVDQNGNHEDVKTKIAGSVSNISVSKGQSVTQNEALVSLASNGDIENQIKSLNLDIQDQENTINQLETQSAAPAPIVAQMDGVVTALTATEGQMLQPNVSIGTVSNLNQMEVSVNIDELDISKVKIGQTAEVSVDAVTGKTFTGKVTSISPVGVATNGVSTFAVAIALDQSNGLLAGMSATANIVISDKKDALMVPIEAVHEINGKDYVSIENKNNQKQMVEVQTGGHTETEMEIIGGLSNGQQIVLPTYQSNNQNNRKGSMFGGMGGYGGGYGGGMGGMGGNRSGNKTQSGSRGNNG